MSRQSTLNMKSNKDAGAEQRTVPQVFMIKGFFTNRPVLGITAFESFLGT